MTSGTLQERLADLRDRLHRAVALEFATLPPYLTALWSIQPGSNRESAAIIRSVMMEEMLHMTLAANVLSAIGGRVDLCGKALPSYPLQLAFDGRQHRDRIVEIHLEPFSDPAIENFMRIELPENLPALQRDAVQPDLAIPGFTIGEFYDEVLADMRLLCSEYGDAAVFTGNPAHQIAAEFFWKGGGRPIAVKDMESAALSIGAITAQGEGADGTLFDGDRHFFGEPDEVAHYFRFKQIIARRYYAATDSIHHPPSGGALAVDYGAVLPIKTDCRHTDLAAYPALAALNRQFNSAYSMMLWQLSEGFSGNPPVFYTAIMNGMTGLSDVARALVSLPIPKDPQGRHAAPSFEWNPALLG